MWWYRPAKGVVKNLAVETPSKPGDFGLLRRHGIRRCRSSRKRPSSTRHSASNSGTTRAAVTTLGCSLVAQASCPTRASRSPATELDEALRPPAPAVSGYGQGQREL